MVVPAIPLVKPDLPSMDELLPQLTEVIANGRVTNFGKYVTEFERKVSEYFGVEAVTTSSGTMGLLLALQAAGVRPGQYVVVPSFTFMASAQAILYAGAIPLFAECREDMTLCVDDLDELLAGPKEIGAVLAVHTFGLPAQTEAIEAVARAASGRTGREVPVVYDAAHAFGSSVEGRRVGSFGRAEVFSLSPTKSLVAVEGGLIASADANLIAAVRQMRGYGIASNYNAHSPGLNGKMSELHAIVGLRALEHFPGHLAARQAKARYLLEAIRGRTVFGTIDWPRNVVHTFKDFSVLLPASYASLRPQVQRFLAERGIETRSYFSPPVHRQEFFTRFADRALPRTDDAADRVLTIPFYSTITEAEMDCVVDALALAGERFAMKVQA